MKQAFLLALSEKSAFVIGAMAIGLLGSFRLAGLTSGNTRRA